MAELKPCPFCGRTPTVDDCGDHRYFVQCKCGVVQDKLYAQKCDAVRRWNTRKIDKDINVHSTDCISRQQAIDAVGYYSLHSGDKLLFADKPLKELPSAQTERLTDDDFETIRIHLNAYKEKLCNQHRWKEAEEYQRIIDRFMSFASAQPDLSSYSDRLWKAAYERGKAEAQPQKGSWIKSETDGFVCSVCRNGYKNQPTIMGKPMFEFCPCCGAKMDGGDTE